MGPILFVLYTGELKQIIRKNGLESHRYVDDNQLYASCKPDETASLRFSTTECIEELQKWMSSNRLKLNLNKTEFMWAASSRRQGLIDRSAINVSGTDIISSTCVKLLGVHIDEDFSAATQISRTVSSGFFHLRQITAIRRCLSTNAAKSRISALVVSRLDYCNSIYAGLTRAQLDRLQSVLTRHFWCSPQCSCHSSTEGSPALASCS